MTFWNRFKNLFGRSEPIISKPNTPSTSANPSLDQSGVIELMHRLEKTMEDAYSCEEVHALLDEYAELLANSEEGAQLMPLVKNHLDRCPDCGEECEALLRILQTAEAG